MANKVATNALNAGDVLYWLNLAADTAVVYKYVCPVNTHKVLSAVQLVSLKCPVHDTTVASESAVAIT